MAWLIGMDEAGYGPNLGPLAVAATAWRLSDGASGEQADLYALLAEAVCDAPDGRRLAIADSKKLYKPGGGLSLLEEAVHAAIGAGVCENNEALFELLGADPNNLRSAVPWHAKHPVALPLSANPEQIARQAAALQTCCKAVGVERPVIRARLVFPAEFNDLVDHYGTKGAALSHVTLALLRSVVDDISGEWQVASGEEPLSSHSSLATRHSIHVTLDKHGGRNRYSALVQHHFPEHWVQTLAEARAESRYRCGPPDAPIHLAFRTRGESFLPTALASMTAKYLRELSMLAFNQFWSQQAPGIKPTAGYPVDAKRFKTEIEAKQRELGIDDRVLWRNK